MNSEAFSLYGGGAIQKQHFFFGKGEELEAERSEEAPWASATPMNGGNSSVSANKDEAKTARNLMRAARFGIRGFMPL